MASKKRLKRTSRGSIILPNGQRITPSEQKALRSAVNSANRKRQRLIDKMPTQAKTKYREFGIESDFVHRKKTASFSRFRNRKEFLRYLHSTQKIASGEFERRRAETYKTNYIRALNKVFNSKANKAIEQIKGMDLKKFRAMVESEELEEIGFVYYDPQNSKLTRIEQQLGV